MALRLQRGPGAYGARMGFLDQRQTPPQGYHRATTGLEGLTLGRGPGGSLVLGRRWQAVEWLQGLQGPRGPQAAALPRSAWRLSPLCPLLPWYGGTGGVTQDMMPRW